MGRFVTYLFLKISDLPRYPKRFIVVVADYALFTLTLWLMLSLYLEKPFFPPNPWTWVVLFSGPAVTVSTFGFFGLYRLVTRYIAYEGGLRMMSFAMSAGLVWAMTLVVAGQTLAPKVLLITYGPATALVAVLSRRLAGHVLQKAGINIPHLPIDSDRVNIVIYGAGLAGLSVAAELIRNPYYNPIAFVDPDASLWRRRAVGLKIYAPERLEHLVSRSKVDEVIVALPEDARPLRRAALEQVARLNVKVRVVPSVSELGTATPSTVQLRSVQPYDLLGRNRVAADRMLMKQACSAKCILVTGAGGSIGSEIVRQALRLRPTRVLLFDSSEAALYLVEEAAREQLARQETEIGAPTEIVSILGSVLDERLVKNLFRTHAIDTVYHAAAYKHVNIVEQNALVALANNVFGVDVIARAAIAANVARVVLISTDKAVLPTSIMGASKRFGEIILQSLMASMAKGPQATILTSVRFGNVLDSSGSVVRKFRRQIEMGGPVTVTDPQATRFFMAVEEAAELVIQATTIATGGEVFILDMGEPVKIDDVARLMIHQAGRSIRSPENPAGEIAIEYIGLRRGEKLHEQLTYSSALLSTEHPHIWKITETSPAKATIDQELRLLREAIAALDVTGAMAILQRVVEGFDASRALQIDLVGNDPRSFSKTVLLRSAS